MVQMPTASSESAPVRLSLFFVSLLFFFFFYYLRCYCYIVARATARGDLFFFVLLFFGEKESPRNEIFVLPRAGGFPFFSLSLSLIAEAFWARAFGALLLLRRRRRLWRSFWCNAD